MNDKLFYRHFSLNREQVSEDDRSIELSMSSEEPVERWFGKEIIMHGKDNIDFSRLNSALLNHDPNRIIGRVENPRIERKKAKAKVVFDDDEIGNMAFAKVKSGSLRGVSIGYAIDELKELEAGETWRGFEGPVYIATKTSIYEASLTPIPADPTVGIGRDATRSLDGINIVRSQQDTEDNEMDEKEVKRLIEAERERFAAEIEAMASKVAERIQEQTKPKFRMSLEEFQELMGRAAAINQAAQVRVAELVAEGKRAEDVKDALLELATTKRDAEDKGDGPAPNDSPAPDNSAGNIRSFKQIEDGDFFAGLSNPSAYAIN